MKRIILFLFIISSVSLFSQSEIWGVRQYPGYANGGMLFSIDSATNSIHVQHRFQQYLQDYRGNALVKIESDNEFLGVTGDELFKFNIETGDIVTSSIRGLVFGDLVYTNNGYCFLTATNNESRSYLYKINTSNLEYETIEAEGLIDYYPRSGLTNNPANEDEIVFWTISSHEYYYKDAFFSYNVITDSLSFHHQINNNFHYPRHGDLIPFNNKFYGMASCEKEGVMNMLIHSYDMENDVYTEEHWQANDSIDYAYNLNWLGGFVLAEDNKMYGAGKLVLGDDNYYMFSFDPENSDFQILAALPDNIGEDPLGRFVLGQDNKIFFNSKDGGEQDEGSIFSYNINTNQVNIIHDYDSLTNFETKGNLTITPDGQLIGLQSRIDTNIYRQIYTFDPNQNKFEVKKNISMNPSVLDGYSPVDFVQLDDGSIIGSTKYGGDSFSLGLTKGKGSLYNFNPNTQAYEKLMNFIDVFSDIETPTQLFKIADNKVLGFYMALSGKSAYEKSFVFNPQSNQIEFVSDPDPFNSFYSDKWIDENDNNLLRANNTKQKLQRYNKSNHEIEDIYSLAGMGRLSNLILMDANELLALIRRNDSVFLGVLNLESFDLDIVTDINRFMDEYPNGEGIDLSFSFVLTAENTLVGDFAEQVKYGKWYRTYHRIVNFDLDNIEMKTISTYRTEMISSKYSFIADYDKNGNGYAINMTDSYGHDAGFLRHIEIASDTMTTLEAFEMPGFIYELDYEIEKFGYRVLKKFGDNSESNSIQEIEESQIKIYYNQEKLVIQSKDYIRQAQIHIFDMSGRLVYEFNESRFSNIEKTVHLKAGAYIIHLNAEDMTFSEKIVVAF